MLENVGKKNGNDSHAGHRKRILEKLQVNEESLCEHEYLEAFLFNALPRRNTNELAHRLLCAFGDLHGVFQAPIKELCKVDGVGESIAEYIRVVGILINKMSLKIKKEEYPNKFSLDTFADFMKKEYGKLGCEVLDVYLLDSVGGIYARKRCTSERESRVEVQLTWLLNLFTGLTPSGILLVHNHPYGEALPSDADNETTEECKQFCKKNGVMLCDHFIYAPTGIYSFNLHRTLLPHEYGEWKGEANNE